MLCLTAVPADCSESGEMAYDWTYSATEGTGIQFFGSFAVKGFFSFGSKDITRITHLATLQLSPFLDLIRQFTIARSIRVDVLPTDDAILQDIKSNILERLSQALYN